MKVGILTFHRPINYGAFLQAYSLSSKLIKEGFDVEIIDYVAPRERRKVLINALWTLKHYGINSFLREFKKISVFSKSQKYLVKSQVKFVTDNLTKLYQYIDKTYDILIIGSDAVFNWTQNGFPSAFLPDYNFKQCKVYSYAASVHGLRYLDEHSRDEATMKRIFENFSLIGARDYQTERFVTRYAKFATPMHCCDPTFFINIEDVIHKASNYKARILSKYGLSLDKKFIVVMLPDNELNKEICNKFRNRYTIISLFNPSSHADFFLYDLNPFEWVAVLSCAKAVITSYFHGTLLSLRVNTPTVTVDYSNYEAKYESKLHDLYNRRLNLPELYFTPSSSTKSVLNRIDDALSGVYRQRVSQAVLKESANIYLFIDRIKN